MIKGIDVSHWQEFSDYTALGKSDIGFCFIKATQGAKSKDPALLVHAAGLKPSHLLLGFYHFYMVGVDPEVQANHFCDVILPLMNDCSLPPALDLEDETNTIESEKLIADIHLFLDVVERRTGRKPIVYTGKYFMQARMGGTQSFKDYPLWDACYRPNPATPYNGWEKPAFWQYSGKSTNAGTVTDGDLFLGTPEELFALTRAGADKDGLSAADWATKYGIKIL